MTSKLLPSDPSKVMVIRDVTPNVTTFSVPFLRFGIFRIGGRGTVVRLSSGALAVFSPVALTPEVKAKLQTLGNNVKYIAALDVEHHIFISDWYKAFPNAHVIGMDGLPEKRAKLSTQQSDKWYQGPQVPFSTVFTAKNKDTTKVSDEFDRDFEYELVHAHPNKELVFYYKPDKVLIEADYLFNLPAHEQYSKTGEPANKGLLTRFFSHLQNTSGTAIWQQRLIWLQSGSDRSAFAASTMRIYGWDFQTIIPCHGDVITEDAKGVFRKLFQWHLQPQKA